MDNNETPDKDIKIVFAEGCFDSFDGTQEELDEFVAKITEMVQSGEIFKKAMPVDIEDDEDEPFISQQHNTRQ